MEVLPTGDPGNGNDESDLIWQLDTLERQVAATGDRVGRLEGAMREAVAEEVRAATAELRRAISELGRRLVQDLPHELARHRDAIVAEVVAELAAELSPPPPPAPPAPPPSPPVLEEPPAPPDAPAPAPAEDLEKPEAAARPRASRKRRRRG